MEANMVSKNIHYLHVQMQIKTHYTYPGTSMGKDNMHYPYQWNDVKWLYLFAATKQFVKKKKKLEKLNLFYGKVPLKTKLLITRFQ